MKGMKLNSQGQSLITVVVASAIGIGAMMAIVTMMTSAFKAQRHVEMKDDMVLMRRALSQGIKCETTIPNPAVCNGTTPLILRDLSGNPLTAASLISSGPLAGSAQMGDYYVRATCSNAERTLTVRVARALSDGTFIQDPMTKRFWDFNSTPNPIFGPARPICQEILGGSTTGQQCPANHVQVGFRSDGQPTCRPIGTVHASPSCPSGQAINTINANGGVVCKTMTQTYPVPVPILTALHPTCTPPPSKDPGWLAGCMAAGNRWCLVNGFYGGATVEYNTVVMYVLCIGAK